MPEEKPEFDLRLLPDWMKEEPSENRYANFQGAPSEDRSRGRSRDRPGGGPRPGRDGRPGQPRGGREHRGEGGRKGGGRGGEGRRGDGHRGDSGGHSPRDRNEEARRPEAPFPAEITFEPDPGLLEAVIKQIRTTAQAFPLFDLARLFLAKPERHQVRLTARPGTTLYRTGEEGAISPDKGALSRAAFAAMKDRFYREETVEQDEIRGHFSSVARCRSTGKILGPTNHHTYQTALRRHFQEHFANRMRFEAFLREIEMVSDPAVVEEWKTAAKRKVVYHTLDEANPVSFKSLEEVERHFRETHLPGLIQEGDSFKTSGTVAISAADPRTIGAIRSAREKALRHPLPMMEALRPLLLSAGLIPFRNAQRNQMFTAIRPRPFGATDQTSEEIRLIMAAVTTEPGISRAALAGKLLPQDLPEAELATRKTALAADLHWLTHAGHIIQYHDGSLEMARPPQKPDRPEKAKQVKAAPRQPVPPAAGAPAEHSRQASPDTVAEADAPSAVVEQPHSTAEESPISPPPAPEPGA